MAQAAPLAAASIQEYLDFEETTRDKHELFRGQIYRKDGQAYAMAGGSINHSRIIVSLTGMCRSALRGRKPCLFVGENERVLVESRGSGYRPGGAIACPPNNQNSRQASYNSPTVLFEVLSPSTEAFDGREKADDYKSLASLQDYVLIESERARVEVFSRLPDGRWAQSVFLAGSIAHLSSVDIDLPLDELYENAVLEPEPRRTIEEA